MLAQARQILHPQSTTAEQQAFAIGWLCQELDAALERIAKLEALNPECRDIIGTTESGCVVHGSRRATYGRDLTDPEPEAT